ncbi:MAG: Lnb N-terminal periplasmic domain-containing protein [Aeoliella sp.]
MLVPRANDAQRRCCGAILIAISMLGCQSAKKMLAPSQHRDWQPLYSVLPTVDFQGEQVTIRNVRYCKHLDKESYVPDWYDKSIDLRDIRAVDFVVMPFPDTPALAHTQVSFEIARPGSPPEYLSVSAEVRKEKGETYGPVKGSARQFELTYVVADERDVIESQTIHYDRDVYLYRSTATPEKAQRLFVDIMGRVNQLATRPEFYDTLTNNCTTNIVEHINRIQPQRVTYDYRVLLPGMSDELAYDQGLIERHGSFDQTKARAYLNPRARQFAGREDFSQLIRR